MSGYAMIRQVHDLEARAAAIGFRLGYAYGYRNQEFGDLVAVMPADERLPIYSRDAELFVGTLTQLDYWLRGFETARRYDTMLFGSKHDQRREKTEDRYLQNLKNSQLMEALKEKEQQ